jgi:hypothetical protein
MQSARFRDTPTSGLSHQYPGVREYFVANDPLHKEHHSMENSILRLTQATREITQWNSESGQAKTSGSA